MTRVSVTELRNALRCPRLFVLGREGAEVRFPVGTSGLGTVFHRLVHRFAQTAVNPPPFFAALHADADLQIVRRELARWLISLLAAELEESPALQYQVREIDELAEALRQFAAYLAQHLLGGGAHSPSRALGELVASSELSIDHVFERANGERVTVHGQIDALFRPAEGPARVVEYKLTDETTQELDEAQVVLYRHLLRQATGVDALPMVLRFTPELVLTELSPADADRRMDELLPVIDDAAAWLAAPRSAPATTRGGLCAACPARARCIERYQGYLPPRDVPPAPLGNPAPPAPMPPRADDAEAEREAQSVARLIAEILRDLAIRARVGQRPQIGPRFVQLDVYAKGKVKQLERAAEDVRHRLQAEREIEATFHKEKGVRLFRVVRARPRTVELLPLLVRDEAFLRASPGRFVLGERVDGSALSGDFADANTAHLLVGGASGGGKSVLLRSMAVSMVHYHGPEAIQLTLVDPKRVSFKSLEDRLGPYLAHPIVYDVEHALGIVRDLIDEMESRYELLEKHAVQDLAELNESLPSDRSLPRHVVVFDEFADLLVDKSTKEEFIAGVARLGAKARAAGIHLALATQRPSKQVVPGRLSDNLPGRVALRVPDGTASRIILNRTGAEQLLGKGDLLAELGGGPIRAQAPLV